MSTSSHRPYTVALTGGIASGKTAVSDAFAALGVPVVDTDLIARELVEPGQPALAEIVATFGQELLGTDGRLDRAALRRVIFARAGQRERLEGILHPAILEATRKRVHAARGAYCLVVIPLLAETGRRDWMDRVLVVDVDRATQVERLMGRDGVDREQALQALAAQASRAQRLDVADDVIDNSAAPEALGPAVRRLHERYLDLAAGAGAAD